MESDVWREKEGGGGRKCGKQRACESIFSEVWQIKELASDFANVWQTRHLVTSGQKGRENGKVKMENGRPPLHPGSFVKSVKTKELGDTKLGRICGTL